MPFATYPLRTPYDQQRPNLNSSEPELIASTDEPFVPLGTNTIRRVRRVQPQENFRQEEEFDGADGAINKKLLDRFPMVVSLR